MKYQNIIFLTVKLEPKRQCSGIGEIQSVTNRNYNSKEKVETTKTLHLFGNSGTMAINALRFRAGLLKANPIGWCYRLAKSDFPCQIISDRYHSAFIRCLNDSPFLW